MESAEKTKKQRLDDLLEEQQLRSEIDDEYLNDRDYFYDDQFVQADRIHNMNDIY